MEDEEYNLLQEEFALYPDRVKFSITLTNRRIRITRAGNTKNEDNVMLDDVTGCHVLQASKESISSAYLCVFSYPLKKKKIGSGVIRQKVTKTFTINTNQTYQENLVIAEMWKMTIKRLVAGEVIKTKEDIENGALATRNLLVLVNPFSGRKKATALYKEKVKPMFLEAEIKHTVRKTEYAGHAKEIAQSLKLEDWDGIVIVSGDGLIHEVINGLMDRPDWEKAIQMPIGVVPGGSGNALAAAIVFASTGYHDVARSATLCTFEICRGLTRPLDILAVETKVPGGVTNATFGDGQSQRNICYSFMGISVGLIADIDIESESIRCLGGELRIAIYSAIRVLFLRKYDLEVSYASCCTHQDESIDTANNDIPNGSGDTGTSHGKWTPLTIPALEKEVPKNWVTVQDNFVLVLANLITHLATNMLAYKNADLDNGKIMLTLDGHNFKRRDCMKAYDLMSSGRGVQDWVNPNQYSSENIECTAFRVIPKERPHSLTVDGETLPFGPFQCWIMPSLVRIMCSS